MHKNDPYIMALAMSESNRRKTIRTGAQMNAPEEPKVVDQAIQSMAAPMPEDVGIGQLPTGEMNYAEGGIVAFSDGGDVPRFQDRGLVKDHGGGTRVLYNMSREIGRMSPLMGALFGGLTSAQDTMFTTPPAVVGAQVPPALRAQYLREAEEMGFGKRMQFSPEIKQALPEIRQALAADTAADQKASLQREQDMAKQRTAALGLSSASPATAQKSVVNGPSAVEVTGTPPPNPASNPARDRAVAAAAAGNRPPAAKPPVAPAAAAGPSVVNGPSAVEMTGTPSPGFVPSQARIPTMDEIKRMYETNMPKPGDVTDPFATEREALTNLASLQNAQEQSNLDREIKERGVLGEKQEKRLKAREDKLGKQEKDIGPLAMLQAGFAIMGGSSRSALQNIGAGAQVGLKGYTEGIEKLQTARERIEDGLERIETARRSEGVLDNQQRRALRKEGNAIVLDGKKDSINALTTELNTKRTQATSLVNAGITALTEQGKVGSAERMEVEKNRNAMERTMLELQGAAQRNAETAGAPLALLRAVAADPKLREIYNRGAGQGRAQREPDIMGDYNDFMKANPQYMGNPTAGMQAFLQARGVLSALGGANVAPAANAAKPGQVLPRKD
jgi:hypothetical protein